MMKHLRGFLSLDVILMIAGAALVVGAFVGVYMKGRHDANVARDAEAAEAKQKRYEMVSALTLDLTKSREDRAADALKHERERRELQADNERMRNAFVPRTADSAQCIRAGFVRYTDAAARGVSVGPAPEREAALAVAGIENDDAAAVIAHNYGLYHDCKARVAELIAEYDSVAAKINTAVGTFKKEK